MRWTWLACVVVVAAAGVGCDSGGTATDTGGTAADTGGTATDIGGATSGSCYSPRQHVATAYEPGSTGCPCDQEDESLCVGTVKADGRAWLVALVCHDGGWQAVEDGACSPWVRDRDATCYAPDLNLDEAHEAGSVGCACEREGRDVCASYVGGDGRARQVALTCVQGRWQSAEDGACAPAAEPSAD